MAVREDQRTFAARGITANDIGGLKARFDASALVLVRIHRQPEIMENIATMIFVIEDCDYVRGMMDRLREIEAPANTTLTSTAARPSRRHSCTTATEWCANETRDRNDSRSPCPIRCCSRMSPGVQCIVQPSERIASEGSLDS